MRVEKRRVGRRIRKARRHAVATWHPVIKAVADAGKAFDRFVSAMSEAAHNVERNRSTP